MHLLSSTNNAKIRFVVLSSIKNVAHWNALKQICQSYIRFSFLFKNKKLFSFNFIIPQILHQIIFLNTICEKFTFGPKLRLNKIDIFCKINVILKIDGINNFQSSKNNKLSILFQKYSTKSIIKISNFLTLRIYNQLITLYTLLIPFHRTNVFLSTTTS